MLHFGAKRSSKWINNTPFCKKDLKTPLKGKIIRKLYAFWNRQTSYIELQFALKNSKKNENRQCKSNETNYRISLLGLSNNMNLIRETIFTPK